jgi:putative membrane protein
MNGDWGYGQGGNYMGGVGFFFCLILMLILVALAFWIIRTVSHHEHGKKDNPLEILDHRFARGEIDLEGYTRDREILKKALGK